MMQTKTDGRGGIFARLIFGSQADEDEQDDEQGDQQELRSAHERAKEDLDRWPEGATEMPYCELCGQVFVSFDTFYEHREASEFERARREGGDGGFVGMRTLSAGDAFPDDARVGELKPCEPDDA